MSYDNDIDVNKNRFEPYKRSEVKSDNPTYSSRKDTLELYNLVHWLYQKVERPKAKRIKKAI